MHAAKGDARREREGESRAPSSRPTEQVVHVGGIVRDGQLKVALVLPEVGLRVPLEVVRVVDQRLHRGLLVEEHVALNDEQQLVGPREQEAALRVGRADCLSISPDSNFF